jgi:hypothetical protein
MPKDVSDNYAEVGCLKRILPDKNNSEELDELYIYSQFEKLFEYLSGNKNFDFLTI